AHGGRRRRLPQRYRAWVPEKIAKLALALDGETAAAVERSAQSITALNSPPGQLARLDGFARQLLRGEALASSRIEGLELSHRRLALAAAGIGRDDRAAEIVGNLTAMQRAIELATEERFTVEMIEEIHRILFGQTVHAASSGRVRGTQNWIGRPGSTPVNADFVPPPVERIRPLLEDLCAFIEREDLPALAQAAIAHAQFETIHPFGDGNGRVGRCLIHVVLRGRGLAPRCVPPISLILAARVKRYVDGLILYREGHINEWTRFFATVADTAADQSERLAAEIADLQAEWLSRFDRPPRAGSAARKLIDALPEQPVLDTARAQQVAGDVSDVAAGRALRTLEEHHILSRITKRVRGRVWEAAELFELITSFEQDLANLP
ncbi:MAG: Fic family protein, partial [Solirubrobacteraceae bacterium]